MKNEHKEKGNQFFRKGDLPNAINQYTLAISELSIDLKSSFSNSSYSTELKLLLSQCHSNRSACFVKQLEFKKALQDINKALTYDDSYIKAMMRKCKILIEICNETSEKDKCVKILHECIESHCDLLKITKGKKKLKRIGIGSMVIINVLKVIINEYKKEEKKWKKNCIKNVIFIRCGIEHMKKMQFLMAINSFDEVKYMKNDVKKKLELICYKCDCRIELFLKYKTKSYVKIIKKLITEGLEISTTFSKLFYIRGKIEMALNKIPIALKDLKESIALIENEIKDGYNVEISQKRKKIYEKSLKECLKKFKNLPKPIMPSKKRIEKLKENVEIQTILRTKKIQEALKVIEREPSKMKEYFEKYPKLYKCCLKIMKTVDRKFIDRLKDEQRTITDEEN